MAGASAIEPKYESIEIGLKVPFSKTGRMIPGQPSFTCTRWVVPSGEVRLGDEKLDQMGLRTRSSH